MSSSALCLQPQDQLGALLTQLVHGCTEVLLYSLHQVCCVLTILLLQTLAPPIESLVQIRLQLLGLCCGRLRDLVSRLGCVVSQLLQQQFMQPAQLSLDSRFLALQAIPLVKEQSSSKTETESYALAECVLHGALERLKVGANVFFVCFAVGRHDDL